MIFADNIGELDYNNNPNPVWGCYGDPVFQPGDIMLQVNGIDLSDSSPTDMRIFVCDVAGNTLEDATDYFSYFMASFTLNGNTYYYVNIQCFNYSPQMLAKGCFVLNVYINKPAGTVGAPYLFNKFTQKYEIINDAVLPTGVTITGCSATNLAALCEIPAIDNTCNKPYVEFSAVFDCVDTFTGDYYGDPGTLIGGAGIFPFAFIRKSWIEGRLKTLPKAIKRTISINCRTQRSETTPKYQLQGIVTFPEWKMVEIENMMLANHLYVGGGNVPKEYQSDGGTAFSQFGKPQNCNYVYKLAMDLQDCYEWQVFGCTPVCASQTYYYPIPF